MPKSTVCVRCGRPDVRTRNLCRKCYDWARSNGTYLSYPSVNELHGSTHTPEYEVWHAMRERCLNPKAQAFASYGGRGIGLCTEWAESFLAFIGDMGPRPSGDLTLDRIDNDGNYEPGNCRWATRREQSNNRRVNRVLCYDGLSLTMQEWADRLGIKRATIQGRLERGWTTERALTAPLAKNRWTRR